MQAVDVRVARAVPTPIADALLSRGCRTLGDVVAKPDSVQFALAGFHVNDVAESTGKVLRAAKKEVDDAWTSADSALQLLRRGQLRSLLEFPCSGIRHLLGNALRPGAAILEVCGLPGCGKTQFCMQLCAAAQASCCGAAGRPGCAEAVYVDTEGSFTPRRYADMCRALLGGEGGAAEEGGARLEQMLRGMHVCRTYDATELYSTLKQLSKFLSANPNVRALVVDSLAFCFRHEFNEDQAQRSRILMDIASTLRRYGAQHDLLVVVTNHMTTRFHRHDAAHEFGWLAPALGETWAHQPSSQVCFERIEGPCAAGLQPDGVLRQPLCRATLTKSVERGVGQQCTFCITEAGLRDAHGVT